MSTATARTARLTSPANRRFARHYLEMLVAMFGGMIVLGIPAASALAAAGMSSTELRNDYPKLLLFGMAVVMTVPMVGWMRHRGHTWRPSLEMAASMLVAMLLRRDEYTGHHHHGSHAGTA